MLEHLSLLLILLQIVSLYLGLYVIGIPDFTITITITRRQGRMDAHKLKYYVELQSGRTLIMNSSLDPEEATWDAYDEACLMDDYLVNITPICDV